MVEVISSSRSHAMKMLSLPPPLSLLWPMEDMRWYASSPPSSSISRSTEASSVCAVAALRLLAWMTFCSWVCLLIRTWKRRMMVLVACGRLEEPEGSEGRSEGPATVTGVLRLFFSCFGHCELVLVGYTRPSMCHEARRTDMSLSYAKLEKAGIRRREASKFSE